MWCRSTSTPTTVVTVQPSAHRAGAAAAHQAARPHRADAAQTRTSPCAAPPDGPTVAAQVQVFQPMLDVLGELGATDPELDRDELSIYLWSSFHGLVALEVNHHLDWLTDTGRVFETSVRRALRAAGLPEPSPDTVARFERWSRPGAGSDHD